MAMKHSSVTGNAIHPRWSYLSSGFPLAGPDLAAAIGSENPAQRIVMITHARFWQTTPLTRGVTVSGLAIEVSSVSCHLAQVELEVVGEKDAIASNLAFQWQGLHF
jgi:hypothetical protein